jgi:hypothetical protein
MKKLTIFVAGAVFGLVAGLALSNSGMLYAAATAGASPATANATPGGISLIINGKDITPTMDVRPQNIEGRVMGPARYGAAALRARVEGDSARQAVIITSDKTIIPGSKEPGYLEPLLNPPHRSSEELDVIYRVELEILELKIAYRGTAYVIMDRYKEDIVYSISGGEVENLVRAYLKQELIRGGFLVIDDE